MKYELHPLCTLFPRLNGAEFEALKEDIKVNGLRQPIVIHDGMILDGGNRYRACVEAGVDPEVIEYSGGNIVSFVLSANLHRRHMTPGQQAAIVASAQDWSKAQSVGNPQLRNVAQLETAKDRAIQSGASHRTQQMADKVAKADPELAKKVAHGEITLPKAVESISPKKEKKQELKVTGSQEDQSEDDSNWKPDEDHIIKEQQDKIDDLQEENEKLRSALAINQIPEGLEIEDADTIIDTLRARVKQLEIEVKAITQSRDTYLRENSQLKEQIRRQAAQLKKLGVKTSA